MSAHWFSNGLMSFLMRCKYQIGHFVANIVLEIAKSGHFVWWFSLFQPRNRSCYIEGIAARLAKLKKLKT